MLSTMGLTYRTRHRNTAEKVLTSVATGVTLGVSLGIASNPVNYLDYGYNPAKTLAVNWALGNTVKMAYNYGCGYNYNPFGYNGGYGLLSSGVSGFVANCLVSPNNFTSSLYADLDSVSGVSSVSPFVNSAINNPLSLSGALGACMIGGYPGSINYYW